MSVSEGQRSGAITFLIAAVSIYGISFMSHHAPVTQLQLPWGEQSERMVALDIEAGEKDDGIYFISTTEGLSPILKKKGLQEKWSVASRDMSPVLSEGTALTITVDNGLLKITDMPAVRRIALGLPIDPNSASLSELSMIPGIGDTIAARIVVWRQTKGRFGTLSDLKKVPGISELRFQSLGQYLRVSPPRHF